MDSRKDPIDLYTELLMNVELKSLSKQMENTALRLELMRTSELLELRERSPRNYDQVEKHHRLKASLAKIDWDRYRHDFTFGGRSVFDSEMLQAQREDKTEGIKFSILTDVTNTDDRLMLEMLSSILDQTYRGYELCVTDNSDKDSFHISKILKTAAESFGGKLKINTKPEGDWLISIRPADLLHPSALFLMAKKIKESGADLVYADEAGFDEYPQNVVLPYPLYEPNCPGAGSEDIRYPVRAYAVSKELYSEATGIDLIRKAKNPVHIPAVLYYIRQVTPEDSFRTDSTQVQSEIHGQPTVSIIIPNKDHKDLLERCINSILLKTTWQDFEVIVCENGSTDPQLKEYYKQIEQDPKIKIVTWEGDGEFNFSALNNFAAKEAKGEYLILLNNDTEVIEAGWIEALLLACQKDKTGVSGCLLSYPDNTIQHAGMCISGGDVFHIGMHESNQESGYLSSYAGTHETAAVTAACMMVSKKVWDELGGLDEDFKVAYNDVDFCLRAREAGYKIMYTGSAKLYHHEGKSRGFRRLDDKDIKLEAEEKSRFIRKHPVTTLIDPYYNPNFIPDGHFLEKIPEDNDRRLGKLLCKYADLPFLIDSDSPSAVAKQVVYVSSVMLNKTEGIRFAFEDDTSEDKAILFADRSRIGASGAGYSFITSVGDTFVFGKGVSIEGEEDYTLKSGRFLGTGFHPAEGDSCWSSQEETTIILPGLKKAAYKFSLLLDIEVPIQALGLTEYQVKISLNDSFSTDASINEENNGKEIVFEVPADSVMEGLNTLTVRSSLWSPADYGSPDPRKLGFSCRGIRAEQQNVL